MKYRSTVSTVFRCLRLTSKIIFSYVLLSVSLLCSDYLAQVNPIRSSFFLLDKATAVTRLAYQERWLFKYMSFHFASILYFDCPNNRAPWP